MTVDQRTQCFIQLGNELKNSSGQTLKYLFEGSSMENPWFTSENVRLAIEGITHLLNQDKLTSWVSSYDLNPALPRKIGLVLAGNIPFTGFHDLLSVLIAGHHALVKLSSKDSFLMRHLIDRIRTIEPRFSERISTTEEMLRNFDAVIATGSDNSARYFEYYFGKYPHLIRRNRTSIAILSGNETQDELENLGKDMFSYFGLGCRNVSKLLIPEGYDLNRLADRWQNYSSIIHHHKYANNYDYQKSILLINKIPFLDNGFALLKKDEKLVSPISVIYFETYSSVDQVKVTAEQWKEKIQCIVGNFAPATTPFGMAQLPELWDYADQIDTLKFLSNLN
jgi:hypothetical protein